MRPWAIITAMTAGNRMMIRRLDLTAFLAALLPTLPLLADPAAAQRRGPKPAEETPLEQREGPAIKQDKTFPLGASWTAISLNGKPISDRRITLQVDQNLRGTGFGGCNTFSASAYPLRQQGFAVGPLALTKRSCDKGVLDFERSYLTALRGARNWDVVAGKLVIKGAAGEIQFDRGI
jgi:heat shock protein HslJ